jgi:hypothetical protein
LKERNPLDPECRRLLKNFPAGLGTGKPNDQMNGKKIAGVTFRPTDGKIDSLIRKQGNLALASRSVLDCQVYFVTSLHSQNRTQVHGPRIVFRQGKKRDL